MVPPKLDVYPNEFKSINSDGGTYSFQMSNLNKGKIYYKVNVIQGSSWINITDDNLDKFITSTPKTIKINIDQNYGAYREGKVEVSALTNINFGAYNSPQTIKITQQAGQGAPIGIIRLEPTELNFGTVDVGSVSTKKTFIINNVGDANMMISSITFPQGFKVTPFFPLPVTISPNGYLSSNEVFFSPTQGYSYSGNIQITGDFEGGVKYLPVYGNGKLMPTIDIPPTLDLGGVTQDKEGKKNLIIKNTGDAPLNIKSITHSDAAFSGSYSGVISHEAGQNEKAIEITFSPTQVKDYSNTITIETNELGEFTVECRGTGLEKVATINLSPNTFDFGDIEIDQSSTKTLNITNNGDINLVISKIEIPDGFSFAYQTGSDGAIEPGASEKINITFSPTSAGDYDGVLKIHSNAVSGLEEISLTGFGKPKPGQTFLKIISPATNDYIETNEIEDKYLTIYMEVFGDAPGKIELLVKEGVDLLNKPRKTPYYAPLTSNWLLPKALQTKKDIDIIVNAYDSLGYVIDSDTINIFLVPSMKNRILIDFRGTILHDGGEYDYLEQDDVPAFLIPNFTLSPYEHAVLKIETIDGSTKENFTKIFDINDDRFIKVPTSIWKSMPAARYKFNIYMKI